MHRTATGTMYDGALIFNVKTIFIPCRFVVVVVARYRNAAYISQHDFCNVLENRWMLNKKCKKYWFLMTDAFKRSFVAALVFSIAFFSSSFVDFSNTKQFSTNIHRLKRRPQHFVIVLIFFLSLFKSCICSQNSNCLSV